MPILKQIESEMPKMAKNKSGTHYHVSSHVSANASVKRDVAHAYRLVNAASVLIVRLHVAGGGTC